MATLSMQSIAAHCLRKSAPLSLKRDIFGVYGNNNRTRSLKRQIYLIQNKPFVRVALVTIQGVFPNLQEDLDIANIIYQNECDAWVYCVGSITINQPNLLNLNQNDCDGNGHIVSSDENTLFNLGRNMGANIVCYYINGSQGTPFSGCASHPPGRRGFWVAPNRSAYTRWTFAHELTHVVGDNAHCGADPSCTQNNTNNLMHTPTAGITKTPPELNTAQCNRIRNDPAMERCD